MLYAHVRSVFLFFFFFFFFFFEGGGWNFGWKIFRHGSWCPHAIKNWTLACMRQDSSGAVLDWLSHSVFVGYAVIIWNRTRPRALVQNQHTMEFISAQKTSHKRVYAVISLLTCHVTSENIEPQERRTTSLCVFFLGDAVISSFVFFLFFLFFVCVVFAEGLIPILAQGRNLLQLKGPFLYTLYVLVLAMFCGHVCFFADWNEIFW